MGEAKRKQEQVAAVTDAEWFAQLVEVANKEMDGHFTIMKFTTNWRVCFGTVEWREDIDQMPVGRTFAEAAQKALAKPEWIGADVKGIS
jgi:hypothetical protein